MIEKSSKILNVKEKDLREFDEYDPFNQNRLKGTLCRTSDHRYGSMVVLYINDEPCEQVIYCTPKLEYPFNRNGDFLWPEIGQLEVWDKLDGTNILAYWYKYRDKKYLSFKTRLSPFLRDNINGNNFLSMWREYCEENSWISNVIYNNQSYNLSFEMYGYRNPITITYSVPLEVSLLFGVRQSDHTIKPPSQLDTSRDTKLPTSIQVERKQDLTSMYESLRNSMSEKNKDDLYIEGMVLYAFCNQFPRRWRQFKCKPEEIQKIHWSSGGIPRQELWNTAINSFEDEESSFSHFIELLREEYTEQQISRSDIRIKKVFDQVEKHIEFTAKVNRMWHEAKKVGFDVTTDKAETFRFLSQFFEKREMRRVGSIILR